jgi:RNA polymerase sigma-70 factor (ECF subfamily)
MNGHLGNWPMIYSPLHAIPSGHSPFERTNVLMTTTDSQREIRGLQDLDPKIVGEIYDRYFPEIYRYALYRIGDQTAAEDIASDVMVRLLEASHSHRPPKTNLRGWLIGTASHAVTDHLRRKYRRPTESLSDSLADPAPQPAAQLDRRETNRAVHSAYTRLTSDQQHVLALRFGQGYSIEETASLMNKNINAVKALQFRALASLQREMGEVDDE